MNLDPNSQDNYYMQWLKNQRRMEDEARQKALAETKRLQEEDEKKRKEIEMAASPTPTGRPQKPIRISFALAKLASRGLQINKRPVVPITQQNLEPNGETPKPPIEETNAIEQEDILTNTSESAEIKEPETNDGSVANETQSNNEPVPAIVDNKNVYQHESIIIQNSTSVPVAPERLEEIEPEEEETFAAPKAEPVLETESPPVDDIEYEDIHSTKSSSGRGGGNNRGGNNNGGGGNGNGGNNGGDDEDDDKEGFLSRYHITEEEFAELMRFKVNHEARNKWIVAMIGIVLSAVSLAGALLGFVRAYNRFFRHKGVLPTFYPMRPITRVAMALGIVLIWVFLLAIAGIFYVIVTTFNIYNIGALIGYMLINIVACSIIYGIYRHWRSGVRQFITQGDKFGSARFATDEEMHPFWQPDGFYIGRGMYFKDKGHILTVAGTRGGKGRDIIIPNLLGAAGIDCSWVVIDPKCENASITSDWQRRSGQNVVILNPWHLFTEHVGNSQSYNPLDLLNDKSSPNLVDDVAMIAEMMVPVTTNDKNAFFTDSARTVVAGLLLHLVTSEPTETRTLTTLWKWSRLIGEDWDKLIQDMVTNDDPVNGDIVANAANEITKLSESGSDTFGSIISNVLQATDFLKSSAMQKSLQTGFDPQILAEGRTTVYVVIPADKLRSHARWLRLVVTSMMRAVIRKPKNRVCFLLDEFAALGYLPEIETALSTYSGYNVTVWPILQSLIQLKNLYKDNWESFIANSAVRQYFSIKDNFSADYISHAAGLTSNVLFSTSWFGVRNAESNQRPLLTPDEIRSRSGQEIFLFINELPVTTVQKVAYFVMEVIKDRGKKNPYL